MLHVLVGTATDYHCLDSRCHCSLTSFLLTTTTHIIRASSCIYTPNAWFLSCTCNPRSVSTCLKAAASFASLVQILLLCTKPHSQNLSICLSVSSFSTYITAPPPLNIICACNHLFAWGTCGASLTSSSTAADCSSFEVAVNKLVLLLYDKQCTMLHVNNHIIQSYCRI